MDDTNKFLLRTIEENWTHARLAEEKRATIAHLSLFIFSGTQLGIVLIGINIKSFPLTLLLVLLGIYGIASTAKLYERSQYHILRARKLRAHLDTFCPDAQVEILLKEAESEHKVHYPHLMKLRLNAIWLMLHFTVLTLGVIYTIIAVIVR